MVAFDSRTAASGSPELMTRTNNSKEPRIRTISEIPSRLAMYLITVIPRKGVWSKGQQTYGAR